MIRRVVRCVSPESSFPTTPPFDARPAPSEIKRVPNHFMHADPTHPHLRLVGRETVDTAPEWRDHSTRREVERETRAAALNKNLDPADPRWVLAARAHHELDGSTLSPERRDRILRTARRLGVRMFEANLIIAIVQDHARANRPLGDAQSLLGLLRKPEREVADRSLWTRWVGAAVLAILANLILIWWLLGR